MSLSLFKFKFKDQKSLELHKKHLERAYYMFCPYFVYISTMLRGFGGDHEVFELFIDVCRPAGHKTTIVLSLTSDNLEIKKVSISMKSPLKGPN